MISLPKSFEFIEVSMSSMPLINDHHDSLSLYSVSPTGSSPLPITPDYGGPSVCYADGVFDSKFGRFVTVREGKSLFSGAYSVAHNLLGT